MYCEGASKEYLVMVGGEAVRLGCFYYVDDVIVYFGCGCKCSF